MPLIPTVPRTYADAHSKFTVLLGYTGDLDAISADVLNEGIDGSCRVTKEGTRYSATDSATETGDAALCDEGAPETLGNSNYEGRMETFRYFNVENPGAADPEADEIFQALKVKGTSAVIVIRETGKRYDLDWEAGDEYSAFRVEADNWQRQQNMTGYIKRTIPTPVQSAVLNGVVAETAGG
ncbi:hypothetical protein [Nesterenkonia jeotgali]|uniref:phage tail tube protein n=1 Tax=Nesterenkonia jeotgali TaxID=317018 RepID=UPI000AFFC602|nr:hypothetical protein [Nesterenkonia jeotgali]